MTDLGSKDDQVGVSTSKTQFYNGSEQFDAGYIYSYWKGRSKSGNTFDVDMFELIQSIDHRNGGYKYVIAPKVGQLAYAIWKAMNAKANKIEQNVQSVENSDLEEKYKVGNKINNLKLNLIKADSSSYSISRYTSVSTKFLITKDNENDIKVKLNISKGDKIGNKLYSIVSEFTSRGIADKLESVEITVDEATVSKFNKEWKNVTLNRVKFSSSTSNLINDLNNKFNDCLKEKQQQEEDAKNKDEEKQTYESCLQILKRYEGKDDELAKFTESIKIFPQSYKNGYARAYKELFGKDPFEE